MILTKLRIKKFRKISNLEFDFKEGINVITGDNGLGKTTILDSILWLLADETLVNGGTNSENLDKNDQTQELEVEGTFIKQDGTELILKRNFKPKFNKEGEFTDYSNKLYINNAEYSVKEYNIRLYNEIGLNTNLITKGFNDIMALCDFDYLGRIDYKKSREKIEKILNIGGDDNLISQEKYKLIKNDVIALVYDLAKAKTMYNKNQKEIETNIEKLNALINEYNNAPKADLGRIEEINKEIEALETKTFDFSKEYLEASAELQNAFKNKEKAENELIEKTKSFGLLEAQYNNIKQTIIDYKNAFNSSKTKFLTLKNSITKCPKCGTELNGEEIKKQLAEIKTQLQNIQKKAEELAKNEVYVKYNFAVGEYKDFKDKADLIINEYSNLYNKHKAVIELEEEKAKQFDIVKNQKIGALKGELKALESYDNSNLQKYENDLENAKKKMAENEMKLQLLEEFKQEKIEAIQKQVAKIFPNIEFLLVEISNTGAISQTCKATYKGVDYLSLNDGQRIKLGIEVLEDLRKALGVNESLPIMINKLSDLSDKNKLTLKDLTSAQLFCTCPSNDEEIKITNI